MLPSNSTLHADARENPVLNLPQRAGADERERWAMRICLAMLALLVPIWVYAQRGVWTPRVEFKLEDASPAEALAWVSGYSYALTEMGRSGMGTICLSKNGVVESRVLLDALNGKFKGQRITAEQAAPAMYAEARDKYRCPK